MNTEADPAIEDAGPIRVMLTPEEPEAGCDVTITAVIDPRALPEATDLLILDAEGRELARADLIETGEELESEPVTLAAPLQAGGHRWQALLVALPEGEEGEAPDPVAVGFTVPVSAHPIGVVVWGVPSAISCGESFGLHVGLKCPCGCDTSGWRFTLRDEGGRVLHEGQVGAEPWAGTEGLRHAALSLAAPAKEGTETWTVSGEPPPDHPAAHAAGSVTFRLVTRPAPEVTITVTVTEAATGAPVPRAKVVVHPYRTLADGNGIATLRVPKGFYTVQVSGGKYFAARTEGEIDGDVAITAELEIDRPFSDADAWA